MCTTGQPPGLMQDLDIGFALISLINHSQMYAYTAVTYLVLGYGDNSLFFSLLLWGASGHRRKGQTSKEEGTRHANAGIFPPDERVFKLVTKKYPDVEASDRVNSKSAPS